MQCYETVSKSLNLGILPVGCDSCSQGYTHMVQAPAEYENGKDSVPLNALEDGCTPEDLCESTHPALWRPSSHLSEFEQEAPCRTKLLRRVKETLAPVNLRMLMQMTAQAMETIWLTRDGQL